MGPFLTTLASRYGFSSLRCRRITLFCILFLVAALFSQGAEAQEKITTVNNPALKRLLYQRQEYDGHGLRYSDIYVLELPSHKNRLFVKGERTQRGLRTRRKSLTCSSCGKRAWTTDYSTAKEG